MIFYHTIRPWGTIFDRELHACWHA